MPSPPALDLPEARLQRLLPEALRAAVQQDPSPANLTRVLDHLRTLHHSLRQYLPRQVVEAPPAPGEIRHTWQDGTLMFTDLAGFTALIDAHVPQGPAGADALLEILNRYFTTMLEIIGNSGGQLLEFTGDALLANFYGSERASAIAHAVRAGLRLQRAMSKFVELPTRQGPISLHMRAGLHAGRYLAADVGTAHRMEHVLLGQAVTQAKAAEAAAEVGRVCLSKAAAGRVPGEFRLEPGQDGRALVVDDFSTAQLGEYDVAPGRRRLPRAVLLDSSAAALLAEIDRALHTLEPLAAFLPAAILEQLVESAARRKIPPAFLAPTVMFVNLIGLPQAVDRVQPGELPGLVAAFSRLFTQINTAVEARGGVLKKVTCDHAGSDMVIYFGAPRPLPDDARQAAEAALAVQRLVREFVGPNLGGRVLPTTCQVGLARGWALAAEIGESRGRREFNVLGDVANTAAHLMNRAAPNEILLTEFVYREVRGEFECAALPPMRLKGKAAPIQVYSLRGD